MANLKFGFARNDSRTPEERREAVEFGKTGEQMAARYLEDKGYTILEHNYRKGHLEIDFIALAPSPQPCRKPLSGKEKGNELVVVEVKTRSYNTLFQPEDAVNHKKRQALVRLANEYVKSHNRTENVRLDVISIIHNDKGSEIKHIENAFNVMNF